MMVPITPPTMEPMADARIEELRAYVAGVVICRDL
jgi:hypothetical protein